ILPRLKIGHGGVGAGEKLEDVFAGAAGHRYPAGRIVDQIVVAAARGDRRDAATRHGDVVVAVAGNDPRRHVVAGKGDAVVTTSSADLHYVVERLVGLPRNGDDVVAIADGDRAALGAGNGDPRVAVAQPDFGVDEICDGDAAID